MPEGTGVTWISRNWMGRGSVNHELPRIGPELEGVSSGAALVAPIFARLRVSLPLLRICENLRNLRIKVFDP